MSTPGQLSVIAETGEFPEPDLLLGDILTSSVELGDPPAPIAFDTDPSGLAAPCFDCHVPPGRRAVGKYGDLEDSFVYVGAWGREHDEAVDLQRAVRRVLLPFRDGGLWKGVQVHRIREVTGPAAIPRAQDAPDELNESGWSVQLRLHRGASVRP